ncbi:hypothetical protein BC936DRAFT_142190 [Jimgerdemannia flammicorona]|uniref:Uncharacterized protein n=1 Tax=Jimgerdemannia flammicorona TaxID=994334 RepID=A0A433A0S3_9FUNG|nr:hypothetical protein BC936DRAFT_142190 [Jimgerdemannia flammicorona]
MPTLFDAPAETWTYEAIAAIYGGDDSISRVFDNIKKDLQRRAERKDRDAVQARKLLDSGWQVSKALFVNVIIVMVEWHSILYTVNLECSPGCCGI